MADARRAVGRKMTETRSRVELRLAIIEILTPEQRELFEEFQREGRSGRRGARGFSALPELGQAEELEVAEAFM